MSRSGNAAARAAGFLALVAVLAVPVASADDAAPPESGTQSPRDPGRDAVIPERSLMPPAEETAEADLDGPFALGYLRKMEGDWESEDGSVAASFRSTAGGTAVLEILFPGSDREMTSIYYLDGKDLVAAVFAPEGNQPRLKFDPRRSFAGRYWFTLSGGTGFDRSRDRHVHEKSLQFTGLDRIDAEITLYEGKNRADSTPIRLIRKRLP